jgi:hypothetical protein
MGGELAVTFNICRKGCTTFTHEIIPNMATWQRIRAHFHAIDQRIPPWECYVQEENRPYYPKFHLADGTEVPDTLGELRGAAGGIDKHGRVLPPVAFPAGTDRHIRGQAYRRIEGTVEAPN